MSEMGKILLTSSLTILGGILILIFGQIIVRFFIDPLIRQRRAIGKVVDALIYHADVYANPGTAPKEVQDEVRLILREKASLLSSRTYEIPLYNFFASLNAVLPKKNIHEVCRSLMYLSNSIHCGDSIESYNHRKTIRNALHIQKEDL